jgi:plasmid stabilization system protein ParE
LIYSTEAQRQLAALTSHYENKGRSVAIRNLRAALAVAESRIETTPDAGLPAPRRYPSPSQQNRAWIKAGRYWIADSRTSPPVTVAVFFETAKFLTACDRCLACGTPAAGR